jgi:hypothetical protein
LDGANAEDLSSVTMKIARVVKSLQSCILHVFYVLNEKNKRVGSFEVRISIAALWLGKDDDNTVLGERRNYFTGI